MKKKKRKHLQDIQNLKRDFFYLVDCIALYVKRLVAWGAISYKELGVDATWFPELQLSKKEKTSMEEEAADTQK